MDGGEIAAELTTTAGTTLRISGASPRILRRDGPAAGTLITEGTTVLDATGPLTFAGNAVYRNRGTLRVTSAAKVGAQSCCTVPAQVDNLGTLVIDPGESKKVTFAALGFANSGTVRLASGTLETTLLPYLQHSGTTELAGGSLAAPARVHLRGGSLRGTGTVTGAVDNDGLSHPAAPPAPGRSAR